MSPAAEFRGVFAGQISVVSPGDGDTTVHLDNHGKTGGFRFFVCLKADLNNASFLYYPFKYERGYLKMDTSIDINLFCMAGHQDIPISLHQTVNSKGQEKSTFGNKS